MKDDPLPGRCAYTLEWILSLTVGSCSLGRCSLLMEVFKHKRCFCLKKKTKLVLTSWTWFACWSIQDVGASLSHCLTVFPRWTNLHLHWNIEIGYIEIRPICPTLSFQPNHECKGMFGCYTLQNLCCSPGKWGREPAGWVAREHRKTSKQSGPPSHLRIIWILASFGTIYSIVYLAHKTFSTQHSYHPNRCPGDIKPSIVTYLDWKDTNDWMDEWIQ